MAWIELHDTLPDHHKVIDVAQALNMDKDLVVGKLVRLWTWALNNREDGAFRVQDIGTIAEVMRFKGKPQRLVDALTQHHLLDFDGDTYIIHDWDERVGMLLARRENQREYAKRKNSLYSDMRLTKSVRQRDGDICQYCGKTVNWNDKRGTDGGTYDHIDPYGENTLENLCVACRSCNSKKKNRTPTEAGMTFIADSPLWQVYGKNTAINKSKKRHEISAITVPKPYQDDDEDDVDDLLRRRAGAGAYMRENGDNPYARLYDEADRVIRVSFKCAYNRDATNAEVECLSRIAVLNEKTDLIGEAIRRAAAYGARSVVSYVSKIVKEWRYQEIDTEDELAEYGLWQSVLNGELEGCTEDAIKQMQEHRERKRALRTGGAYGE